MKNRTQKIREYVKNKIQKTREYVKNAFTIAPRTEPKKIWCFYKDPYRIGLATTIMIALGILTILSVIALVGGGAFLVMSLIGAVVSVVYYGILLALAFSGLVAIKENFGAGIVLVIITFFIANYIDSTLGRGVNAFISGMFNGAFLAFDKFSSPLMRTLEFIQIYWIYILGVIVAPAVAVCTVAGLYLASMYTLQGIEKAIQKRYGIRMPCPVCTTPSEPAIYSCPSCNHKHEVPLIPSQYGVLKHTCTNCGDKLPTQMIAGRNKTVKRACRECNAPLNDVTGIDKHVALVGGRNAGKTCMLVQMVRYFKDSYVATIPERDQNESFEQLTRLVEKGEVPPQTQQTATYRAFQMVYPKKPYPYHLYLYDIAGENFEHIFESAKYPFYQALDAIVFIFDPYSIKSFRNKFSPPNNMAYSSQEPFEVLQNLIQALDKHNEKTKTKKIKLDVVLVKTDTGYLNSLVLNNENKEEHSSILENYVNTTVGHQAFTELAKLEFKSVKYYQVSALGRTPEMGNRQSFEGSNLQNVVKSIFKAINVSFS